MSLRLEPFARASAEARAALQRVLEAAPGYSQAVAGSAAQAPGAAADLLAALPPGFPPERKYVWGVWRGPELVGVIDLLRGFPRAEAALIGLLLFREDEQARGAGREAFAQLEAIVRGWSEITAFRIGVVRSNSGVLGFWRKLGFAETGELRPYENGAVRSETIVLEKSLR